MKSAIVLAGILAVVTAEASAQPRVAARRVESAIVVDGRLDEGAWGGAPSITEFKLTEPVDGGLPAGATSVRVLIDDRALYVGVEADGAYVTHLGRRDADLPGSDWFHVKIDSRRDYQMAFEFAVNPSGVKRDRTVTATNDTDESWEPVWEVRTIRAARRWSAEIRIPLSSLRYKKQIGSAVWGIAFMRVHAAAGETSGFPHSFRSERGGLASYADLTDLGELPNQSLTELAPHALIKSQPGTGSRDVVYSAGLDLIRSLSRDATVTATVNPDFGQVEADPAVVNLSQFELQFPERRQFFVEDADLFRLAPSLNENPLFYSRRIGAAPLGRVDADRVEYPTETRIAVADRFVARTRSVSAGVMHALTLREEATITDESGALSRNAVAVPANYLIGRVQTVRDGGRRVAGLMATGFLRSSDDDVDDFQRRASGAIGADFKAEFANRVWSLTGYAAGSVVEGSTAAIAAAQRSSARYYQRPDASHLHLTESATKMSGAAAGARLAREAGKHWLGSLAGTLVTPGFEINDVGLMRRADLVAATIDVAYRSQPNRNGIREAGFALFGTSSLNTGGEFLGNDFEIEGTLELTNRWEMQLELGMQGGGVDDRLTRGGPAARRFGVVTAELELGSDARRKFSAAFEAQAALGETRRRGNLWLAATARPRPNLMVSVTPELNLEVNDAQYIRAIADESAESFRHRYVFMKTSEESFSIGMRVEVVASPTLTFQLYARPFAASVHFRRPSELSLNGRDLLTAYGFERGTATFSGQSYDIDPNGTGPATTFTLADPSFSTTSLNTNVTARWEWRPGSTLFVVWQNASDHEVDSAIGGAEAFRRLSRLPPRNVVVVKLTYRLGRIGRARRNDVSATQMRDLRKRPISTKSA